MKRIEAVKEIFETLELAHSHPEANAKLAEQILAKLESIGMLPPMKKMTYLEYVALSDKKKYDCNFDPINEFYKWEVE